MAVSKIHTKPRGVDVTGMADHYVLKSSHK